MKIGSDYIFVDNAFIAGFTGIAQAVKNLSKWCMTADVGTTAMIFKSYDWSIEEWTVQDNIAD